jgi:hypothetical protein
MEETAATEQRIGASGSAGRISMQRQQSDIAAAAAVGKTAAAGMKKEQQEWQREGITAAAPD